MALSQVEMIIKIYKSLAQNSALTGARIVDITKDNIFIQSAWSQRNLERRISQKFVLNHVLNKALKPISEGFPIDTVTELTSACTEDEQRKAVLRSATIENSTKQFIEIWNKQRLFKNYDLAALDVHGDVYIDSEFGSFEWSPDNSKLLYIAEKKLPKSEPFYKQKSLENKEKENKDEDKIIVGNEYIHKPHWGEQLPGKHRPVIAVLDTTVDTITVLPGIPDELSPGQVLWTKDSKSVIGVTWKHEPRQLGLVAYNNRPSWIFLLHNGKYEKLSNDGCSVHSPRITPNGKYIVWLEREIGGPHRNVLRLMCLDLESQDKKVNILINTVETNILINNEKVFYGLYNRLPQRCWSKDSQYLFFTTSHSTNNRSYIFDMTNKVITEIQNDETSLSILDIKEDVIVFLRTSLLEPSRLCVGYFNVETAKSGYISRVEITTPSKIPKFDEFMYESTIYEYDTNEDIKIFNFTYFGPKNGKDKSIPLIIMPHGGPHANYANIFSLDCALFTLLGMAVLQINYRGSTGMGSKNVEYLQGKVGTTDVKDCVTATQEALKKYSWLNPLQVGVCGGSHGGFLATHLSGQHPDLYKVVVTRNPVIDIAVMFSLSDTPDCRNTLTVEEKIAYRLNVCTAVLNIPYKEQGLSKEEYTEIFVKMLNCSPIVYVNNVKAPTLLCIGSNDLRVPPYQGKEWYNRLKANGVKTKMLIYEDNHQLGSGTSEIDCQINGCLWFMEHFGLNKNTTAN